jgi:Tat protein secretion system quality control protein TatD with DNase activity
MPTAIQNVVNKVAELRQSTPERIEKLVHANFLRPIGDN